MGDLNLNTCVFLVTTGNRPIFHKKNLRFLWEIFGTSAKLLRCATCGESLGSLLGTWLENLVGCSRCRMVPSGFIKHGRLENPRTEWRFLARKINYKESIFMYFPLPCLIAGWYIRPTIVEYGQYGSQFAPP